jgi:hypothetical protein
MVFGGKESSIPIWLSALLFPELVRKMTNRKSARFDTCDFSLFLVMQNPSAYNKGRGKDYLTVQASRHNAYGDNGYGSIVF